jgi:hypothetical protein
VKKKSQNQEKRCAKKLSGKTVVASGALWGSKGDVRTDEFLIECKTTDKKSYSLKKEIWEKIEKEALHDGMRIPMMNIELDGGKVSLAVLNMTDFLGLLEYKRMYEGLCK